MDQPHASITKTGTDAVGLGHNLIIADTTANVAMTPTEAVPGHATGTTDNISGVVHDAHTQVLIHTILTTTPHTTDQLHIRLRFRFINLIKPQPCNASVVLYKQQ